MDQKILIVIARFYGDIADAQLARAVEVLAAAGAPYDVMEVPGVFEIPAAVAMAAGSGGYGGYVALGCVIRGETSHYDYVCAESARGLNDLAIHHRAAIGYGILTVENEEQARARLGRAADAAKACLRMMEIKMAFTGPPVSPR